MLQLYFEEMTTEVITQREAYTFFAFLCKFYSPFSRRFHSTIPNLRLNLDSGPYW